MNYIPIYRAFLFFIGWDKTCKGGGFHNPPGRRSCSRESVKLAQKPL